MAREFGKHTTLFVAAAMAIGGAVALYYSLPMQWMLVAAVFGLYEAWTIANKHPHDTISEAVWRLTKGMPLIPYAFGIFTGWLIGIDGLSFVSVAYGVLMGHFFFSRACAVTEEEVSLGKEPK